jgi:hypothetical protein
MPALPTQTKKAGIAGLLYWGTWNFGRLDN